LTAGIPQTITTQKKREEDVQTLLITKVQHICGKVCQQNILFAAQKAWKGLGMYENTALFRELYYYDYHHHHIYYIHYYYYNRLYYKLALLALYIPLVCFFYNVCIHSI
jgi:hypothetical protein